MHVVVVVVNPSPTVPDPITCGATTLRPIAFSYVRLRYCDKRTVQLRVHHD